MMMTVCVVVSNAVQIETSVDFFEILESSMNLSNHPNLHKQRGREDETIPMEGSNRRYRPIVFGVVLLPKQLLDAIQNVGFVVSFAGDANQHSKIRDVD